jgi:hypothetical protein
MRPSAALLTLGVLLAGCTCSEQSSQQASERTGERPRKAIVVNGKAYKKSDLAACLGITMAEMVQRMRLDQAKSQYWVDEPPGILRGREFYLPDGTSVTLYISDGDPLFREFSERREWDQTAFLKAGLGGATVKGGGVRLDVGNVPWQWLPASPDN